jgi:hypothetical protein
MELDALPRPDWPIDPENADGMRDLLENELYNFQKHRQED